MTDSVEDDLVKILEAEGPPGGGGKLLGSIFAGYVPLAS